MDICKWCGQLINWRRTKAGKWQPMNLDGSVHFPTCRARVGEGRRAVRDWYAEFLLDGDEVPQCIDDEKRG